MSPEYHLKRNKTTKKKTEKLLDQQQVFKNHNCHPFQSSSTVSIRAFFCISSVLFSLSFHALKSSHATSQTQYQRLG